MSLTFEEVKEKLKDIDEVSLLEKLEIYSDDIVERFQDKIEDKYENLSGDLEEEEYDE